MSNKPLVSIIIPTYNQLESYLRESIESAINQTYRDIEILISDNHSTNGASEIIAAYAATDSRIRIVKPPQFLSLLENFIFSYDKASGEYICPLSSDDLLYPEMVAEQVAPFFTYPDLSLSYSIPLFFTTDINKAVWKPGKIDTGFYPSDNFLELFIKYRRISWGGILFKKSDYQKTGGFSKEIRFTGDIDMAAKLILLDGGVYCINKALSAIRNWERVEQTNRTPYMLAELAEIYDNIADNAVAHKNTSLINTVKKGKRKIFSMEVFPIAYLIQFNKRTPEIIEKTVVVIKDNYPKGIFNFVIQNRKNKIGLVISFAYLGFMRIKNWSI